MQNFLTAILLLCQLSLTPVDRRRFLSSVAEEEGTCNLGKNLPYEVFVDEVLCFDALLDNLLQIPALTVFHDDVNFEVSLVNAPVVVAHNVRMIQVSENIDFSDNLLLFLLVHLSVVKFFPDKNSTITYPPNFAHIAKASYDRFEY